MTKLCQYFYLFARVELLFTETIGFHYSKEFMLGIKIGLIILCTLLAALFCSNYPTFAYNTINGDIGICEVVYPVWIIGISGFSENLSSLFTFWLFYNGMKKLKQTINQMAEASMHSDKNTTDLQWRTMYIVRKCTILYGFTIFTTWMFLGFITLFPVLYLITAMNSIIDVIALLLQDSRYDDMYLRFFGCIARKKEIQDHVNTMNELSRTNKRSTITMQSKSAPFSKSTLDTKSTVASSENDHEHLQIETSAINAEISVNIDKRLSAMPDLPPIMQDFPSAGSTESMKERTSIELE